MSSPQSSRQPGAPRVADLRDVHDRVRIIRRDVASARALAGDKTLAGVRLTGALDVIDNLLRDLEREGVAA